MLDPHHERNLIERRAFRELYRHYFSRIYDTIAYRVGSQQDAEDLVADTFLKAYEKFDSFTYRGEGSFAAWLFRIATTTVADYYRRTRPKYDAVVLDDDLYLMADGLALDSSLIQQEKFTRLRTLIGQLPRRRQEVITLRFFGGLRNKEIAEVLGLTERTVASHLCRGLEDLQRHYVALEDTHER